MSRKVGFQTENSQSDHFESDTIDPWDGILDRDEKILWQGRPDSQIRINLKMLPLMVFGVVFAGFALIWMIMASFAGGFFWMFGLLHFSAGMAIIIGPTFAGPYRRARTWYTLTNKRALIATDFKRLGRNLKSYPITKDAPIELNEAALSTIYFVEKTSYSKTYGKHGNTRKTGSTKIGFELIEDGAEVAQHIRRIQRDLP